MATKSKSSKRSNKSSSKRAARKESPDATELLQLELQEIHSAENQLTRILPRLVKSAESEKLQQALEARMQQGERLIQELEAVFDEMEASPGRKKNVAAEGLINDMREHIQEIEQGPALDAVLIAAIQKTEHYCIAAWGTARSLAQVLEQETTVESMERALKEGKAMDEQLTELAEQEITPQLLSEESDEDEGEEEADAELEAGEEEDEEEEAGKGRKGSRRSGGSERRAPH
jgi:ferritin-like metal-binding protein YciE